MQIRLLFSTGLLISVLMLTGAGCAPAKETQPTADPTDPAATQPAATEPVAANAIAIEDYKFAPAILTVKKGTTVIWTNKDIAKHTVTGKNGGPKSALFGQNETYSYTFDTVGTYDYFCEPHPYMKASVVVTE